MAESLQQGRASGIADNEAFIRPVGIEGDDRRHKPLAVFAGNDDRGVALHVRNQGVRGAEIDSYNALFCHGVFCSLPGSDDVTQRVVLLSYTPCDRSSFDAIHNKRT